jgi:hypothetical protein
VIVFHSEHLRDARLSFAQKVHVARSYALRKNSNSIWNLILEINSLRNEIAHRLEAERRRTKMLRLRELCRAKMTEELYRGIDAAGDEAVVTTAYAMCLGFLADFEHDTRALRGYIDALDTVRNPERERMSPA